MTECLKFHRLSQTDEKYYNELYGKQKEKSADYTFVNLWCWQNKYRPEVAFAQDLCWIRIIDNGTKRLLAPVGNYQNRNWRQILSEYFTSFPDFIKVPESFKEELEKQFAGEIYITADRNNWEYVYSVRKLIELQGSAYANKRKAANRFMRENDCSFGILTSKDAEEIRSFQQQWLQMAESGNYNPRELAAENEAIKIFLQDWTHFQTGVFGFGIWIHDKLAAFALGECVGNEELIIHFEKADKTFPGIYPAVNRLCLENFSDFSFVNREQDLGNEGLRKVKTEYNPEFFIKKYNIGIR